MVALESRHVKSNRACSGPRLNHVGGNMESIREVFKYGITTLIVLCYIGRFGRERRDTGYIY